MIILNAKIIMKFILLSLLLVLSGCSSSTADITTTKSMGHSMDHSMHSMAEITSEKQFIQEMIPHHEEAITSSQELLKLTKDPKMIAFLNGVITLQQSEIDQMKQWHLDWFATEYESTGTYAPMMTPLSGKSIKEAQTTYAADMIQHHLAAIKMANQLLELDPRIELETFASNIISVQADEIEKLKQFL
jgi:uncharacterized protein (DUF305 family)